MEQPGRDEAYVAVVAGAAFRLVRREAVLVAGPGALEWLQGQVSQDLEALQAGREGTSADTLVLSPQGKIDAFTRVTALAPERFVLDVGVGFGEGLRSRLARFKLRVKADLSEVRTLVVAEVRGARTPSAGELSIWAGGGALAVVDVRWPPLEGRDVLFEGEPSAGPPPGCLELADDEAFEALRIEAGIPAPGRELTERTIPQEAGDLVAHTVSFTKGCYTGQELVARVDARGSNTPRRLRGIVIEGDPPGPASSFPIPGDMLSVEGHDVGSLTSVAWSQGLQAYVALAYVKRGVEVTEAAQVTTAGARRQAAIRALPLVSADFEGMRLQRGQTR